MQEDFQYTKSKIGNYQKTCCIFCYRSIKRFKISLESTGKKFQMANSDYSN